MLYIEILPNRGARIGHQSSEYMKIVAFCKKTNYTFVYKPFIGNSKHFNNILKFDKMYSYVDTSNFKIIYISELKENAIFKLSDDIMFELRNDTIFNVFDNLHKSKFEILITGDFCDNIWLSQKISSFVSKNDVMKIYNDHYKNLNKYYLFNIYPTEYNICVHIRRGDTINNTSRKLELSYFESVLTRVIQNSHNVYNIFVATETNCENITLFLNTFGANLLMISDIETFKYLSNADILIASKSGFSNLCHLMSNNIVIKNKCDGNLYYKEREIIATNDGLFDIEKFKVLEKNINITL